MGAKPIAFLRDLLKQLAGVVLPLVQVQIQAGDIAGTLLVSSKVRLWGTGLSRLQQLIELAMAQGIGDGRCVVSHHEWLFRDDTTLWRRSGQHQFG